MAWNPTVTLSALQNDVLRSRDEKELIRTADQADLGQFHFGFGTGIREIFHMWHGNKELLKSCGSKEMHPDDAAMVIIEALWRRLQTKH